MLSRRLDFVTRPNHVHRWRLKLPNHSGHHFPSPIPKYQFPLGSGRFLSLLYPLNRLFSTSSEEAQPRNFPNPSIYDMSLAIIGAAVLVLCIVAYAMSYNTEPQVDLHDPRVFQERKDLYRKQRDDFRSNSRAMEELVQWKAKNNDYEYRELYVHPYVPLRDAP